MPTAKAKTDLTSVLNGLNPSVAKIQKKLEEAMQRSTRSNNLWKPVGSHDVRIIPYKHGDDLDPFIQVFFHWGLGDNVNYIVCPKNTGLGENCPICDFVAKLWATKDPKQIELAKQIRAKSRWYVPVIVRGEEEEGVKFWGFGGDVRKEFFKYIGKRGYDEPFHPLNGFDWSVEYVKSSGKPGDYGQRTVVPLIAERGAVLPLPEDEAEQQVVIAKIIDLINDTPDFFESGFKAKTEDELLAIIQPLVYGKYSDDDDDDDTVEESTLEENEMSTMSKDVDEEADIEDKADDEMKAKIAGILAKVQGSKK